MRVSPARISSRSTGLRSFIMVARRSRSLLVNMVMVQLLRLGAFANEPVRDWERASLCGMGILVNRCGKTARRIAFKRSMLLWSLGSPGSAGKSAGRRDDTLLENLTLRLKYS